MRELNSPNRDRLILLPSQKNLGWEHHKNDVSIQFPLREISDSYSNDLPFEMKLLITGFVSKETSGL